MPEPCGGVLIIGNQSIIYCKKNDESLQKSPVFLKYGEINNYCMIDSNGQRYLLANTIGNLYLMILIYEKSSNNVKIVDIQVKKINFPKLIFELPNSKHNTNSLSF